MVAAIICVEGADGAGKTTLVNYLRQHHGARTMHGKLFKNFAKSHAGMLRRAVRLAMQGELVILDRHWPSNQIYGSVFGNGFYANDLAWGFDLIIHSTPGLYVLCVPKDIKKHLKRFEQLKATGREAYDRVEQVMQGYADLLYGSVARPGDNYLDLYCRFGDFTSKRRVVHYDMDRDGSDLEKVSRKILTKLKEI